MSKFKVSVTYDTELDTQAEVDAFLKEIGAIHSRRYATNAAEISLVNNYEYFGSVNEIVAEVEYEEGKVPGVFEKGDPVRILGFEDTDPNHEGRVDFVKDGRVFVNNMNMPYAGSIHRFFEPSELEHYE